MSSVGPEGEAEWRALERKREIREVVLELLDSPLDLPDRFRGWIPRLVESSGIQVPISQVVGNYVSADSVAGLGAKIHGRRGMVRAGASDFNFVELVYDAVAGRWVSSPVTVMVQRQALDSTTSTSYVDSTECVGSLLSWTEWSDANLTMVFRYVTAIRTTNAARTASSTLQFTPYTVNGAAGTPVNSTDHEVTISGTTNYTLKDSGWQPIPASVVASDFLLIEAQKKISNAAAECQISGCTAWMRWVSS